MSNPDEPKKKPPQPTVAWDPEDLPFGEGSGAGDKDAEEVQEEVQGDAGAQASDGEDPLVGRLLRG